MRRNELPSHLPAAPEAEPAIAKLAAQLSEQGQSVEILALTQDEDFLATLREAADAPQRIHQAPSRERAVELIMAGRVGVIVIDTPITAFETGAFCDRLRVQFPDLILLVSGTSDDQGQLVKQITAGDIYRFLHKPVSPARARHFLDAAVRRHLDGRTFTPAEAAPVRRTGNSTLSFIAGAVLLALAIGAFALFGGRESSAPVVAQQPAISPGKDDTTPRSAAPARSAVPAARTGPIPQPATISRAAEQDPDQTTDRLLSSAETAMLEARLQDAARDIEAARAIRPNNMRLAFLSAQLSKERERQLIAAARLSADKGNFGRARTLLDQAAQGQTAASPALVDARRDIEQRRLGQNADNLLKLASLRLQEGHLIEPEGDSAKSYIEAALAADPGNATAAQARRALADETVARARQAMAQGDLGAAASWLAQAQSLNASGTDFTAAQRELQAAEQTRGRREEQARLLNLINQRIAQDRLLEPANDSAQFYWQTLKALEPANPSLPSALQSLGSQLVKRADQATERREFDAAQRALDEARALGFSSPELISAGAKLNAGRERAAFLANVVPATTLARTAFVELKYPADAERRGLEGWVEMEFTVAADGSVKDLELRGAAPAGVFDSAALDAVAKWKYRPVVRNGRTVEQRARLRVNFNLKK